MGPSWIQDGPSWIQDRSILDPERVHPGPSLGPGDPEPDPDPDPSPDELSGPNQGPLPSRPGKKYVAQGTLAAIDKKHKIKKQLGPKDGPMGSIWGPQIPISQMGPIWLTLGLFLNSKGPHGLSWVLMKAEGRPNGALGASPPEKGPLGSNGRFFSNG